MVSALSKKDGKGLITEGREFDGLRTTILTHESAIQRERGWRLLFSRKEC